MVRHLGAHRATWSERDLRRLTDRDPEGDKLLPDRAARHRPRRHRLRIRLDSGRTVEFDPRAYDRLTHGYAATVHKAQGATVDRAYILADTSP